MIYLGSDQGCINVKDQITFHLFKLGASSQETPLLEADVFGLTFIQLL